MRLEDLKTDERIFALFKGDPKTGKSIAAHSFHFGEPVYTFDLDARMESVLAFYTKFGKLPNVEYDRFTDFFSIHQKLEELKQYCPYRLVVLDSLSALAFKSIQTMIDTRTPSDKNKIKDRGGIVLSMVEDFGGEANAIRMVMDNLLTISLRHNVSVIVTAHVITPESGAYRPMRTLLTGGKKIAAEIPINFNEAYHFFVQTSGGMDMNDPNIVRQYIAVTRTIGTDWAATALPIPDIIDFTDTLLYQKILEEIDKSKQA